MQANARSNRLAAVLAAAALAAPACGGRAPRTYSSDEVYDPNVSITALKDNGLGSLAWPVVDNYMNALIDADEPGCAIGIARAGELVYLHGYGKAELGGKDWSVSTVGAVGSVSKTFTAAGLLLMHQLGLVDVNASVGTYLDGNAAVDGVMIAKLLNHTSGVGGGTQGAAFGPNWADGTDAADCADGAALDCTAVAKDLRHPLLAFDQYGSSETVAALAAGGGGTLPEANYSNVGYSIAGAIIDERTSATTEDGYEEWIWNRIGGYPASNLDTDNMLSLALTHSWRADDIPDRAVGYQPSGGGFTMLEAFDTSGLEDVEGWEGPSGGWAMTIGDLTRFALALNTGKIVDGAMLAAMRFPWAQINNMSERAGMGMLLPTTGPQYWHGGLINGHTAAWTWWDNNGGSSLAIAMICNRTDLGPSALRDHAAKIAAVLPNSQPFKPLVALPPTFNLPSAHGRSWGLDTTGAWQATPRGAVLPLTALSYDLVLRATVSNNAVSFTLAEAAVTGDRAVLAAGRTPTPLGIASVTNPRFSTRPTDLRLASDAGDVPVHGVVFTGAFDRQGEQLSTMSLRGTLDAREVGALVGRSGPDLCKELATTGTSCTRCADGATACLPFAYEGYVGREVVVTAQ